MAIPSSVPMVARKTITTIDQGSQYKEQWTLPGTPPTSSTTRMEWRDSSGTLIKQISGTVSGKNLIFNVAYSEVAAVPNGAGFYCYVHLSNESSGVEHLVCYGSTFRRQMTF